MAFKMTDASGKSVIVAGKGADGVGVPTGGTTGQILKKATDDDFNTQWADNTVDLAGNNVTGVLPVTKGGTGGTIWPSNPNLLDNAYWANKDCIINQRGQDEYTGAGYTIDRWRQASSDGLVKTAILDDGITIQCSSPTNEIWFQEILETDYSGMGIMTLSILVAEITGDAYLCLSDGGVNTHITASGLYTATNNMIGSTSLVRIAVGPNSSLKIKAIKLELGPVQTLAHKEGDNWVLNDPPPNKALELAKCQRYLKPLRSDFYYSGWLNQGGVTIHLPTDVLLNMGNATPSILAVDTTNFQIAVDGNGVRKTLVYSTDFTVGISGKHVALNLTSSGSSKLADLKSFTVGVWKSTGNPEFLLSNEP